MDFSNDNLDKILRAAVREAIIEMDEKTKRPRDKCLIELNKKFDEINSNFRSLQFSVNKTSDSVAHMQKQIDSLSLALKAITENEKRLEELERWRQEQDKKTKRIMKTLFWFLAGIGMLVIRSVYEFATTRLSWNP